MKPSQPVFTVYKTTHLESGKIYIGVHKTKDPEDAYLGSGKVISAALKKYGPEAFRKEVLFIFATSEEALQKEEELVNEVFVTRQDTYNLALGGKYDHKGNHKVPGEKNSQYGTVWVWHLILGEKKIKKNENLQLEWNFGRHPDTIQKFSRDGRKLTKEEISRLYQARQISRHHNRPLYMGLCVNSEGVIRRIQPGDLTLWLQMGWKRGSGKHISFSHSEETKEMLRGRRWVSLGEASKKVKIKDLQSFIDEGWTLGRCSGKRVCKTLA